MTATGWSTISSTIRATTMSGTAGGGADAHYHSVGWHEGRDPDAFLLDLDLSVAQSDVKASGADPLAQFEQGGWRTSDPSINFDINAYLKANPDVAAAGVDPLAQFLASGEQEGRQPIAPATLVAPNGFDYVYYLQHNPDVAAAHVDPFATTKTVGWREGRQSERLLRYVRISRTTRM